MTDLSVNQQRNVEVVRGGSSASLPPGGYRVKRGDTLYSIAFRYGLDYRKLARDNNINNSFTIFPGQVLIVKSQEKNTKLVNEDKARDSQLTTKKPSSSKNNNTPKVIEKPVSTQTAPKIVRAPVKSNNTVLNVKAKPIQWRWPSIGKVTRGFSGESNKGINIAGKKGDPVFAAATGKVVYAGSGLHGYGNLVIINHSQEYLSAYAHNSKILVKESDNVKVGEKIAEIGNSGAVNTMLHFEIRKDGKPVNPLRYLPKR